MKMAVVFENSKDAVTHFKVWSVMVIKHWLNVIWRLAEPIKFVFTLLILDILLLMTHFMDIDVWISL